MPSDRSRRIDRAHFGYTGVVAQQGRVILDRDFNAQQGLESTRVALDALAFVGPCGTPDDGYKITIERLFFEDRLRVPIGVIASSPPVGPGWNLSIAAGRMYLGGQAVALADACTYHSQPEWPNPTPVTNPAFELVYLDVQETEVSAIEDSDLLDVALGGPDTTQRLKLLQRIKRMQFTAADSVAGCASAWTAAIAQWRAQGLGFDPLTMSLKPLAALQVAFDTQSQTTSACDPASTGGYLGSENQLLRIRITNIGGQLNAVWGYDDASFIYRVNQVSADGRSLSLTADPPDAFHFPQTGQWVEILPVAAVSGETAAANPTYHYVSETIGNMHALAQPYGPINAGDPTNYLVFAEPAIANYAVDPMHPYFVRVWQSAQPINAVNGSVSVPLIEAGTGVNATSLGVIATISWPSDVILAEGATWEIAVRPNTPQSVYPAEYLASPQLADGPRRWVCPLAFIDWTQPARPQVSDCRNRFDNLVALTRRKPGCCTFSIAASDVMPGMTLQALIDRARDMAALISGVNASSSFTICLGAGNYALPAPLVFDVSHSGMTIEACGGLAILSAIGSGDPKADVSGFVAGLVQVIAGADVTLRGLEIHPPEAPVPSAIVNGVGKIVGNTGLRIAALGSPRIGFGIRAVNAANLTIEDCSVIFQAQRPDAQADLIGAGLFAQGDCTGLFVSNCNFTSDIAPTFNPLQLSLNLTSPIFKNIVAGLSDAAVGNRASLLTDVGLTETTLAVNKLADVRAVGGGAASALAMEAPTRVGAAESTVPATNFAAVASVAPAAAALVAPAAVASVAPAAVSSIAPAAVDSVAPAAVASVAPAAAASVAPAAAAAAAVTPAAALTSADLLEQRTLAAWESVIALKQGQGPKPPVIATAGFLAADAGSPSLNVAALPCYLGDCAIEDNAFDNLAFGVFVAATFDSLRIQNNLCVGTAGGIWITLSGAVTPQPGKNVYTAYYPAAENFAECQLLRGFSGALSPPQRASSNLPRPGIFRRFIGPTRLNAITVSGNNVQNNTFVPVTSPPTPHAVSSCALLLALCQGVSDFLVPNESSAAVSANLFRSGSGFEAPSVLITLGNDPSFAMAGNVVANAVFEPGAKREPGTQPALSIETSAEFGGIGISGNVMKGTSNLSHVLRNFPQPVNTMSLLNADPS
jgi:Family of unknown function (DUF6519)